MDGLLRQPLAERINPATVVLWEHPIVALVLVPFLLRAFRALRRCTTRDRGAIVLIGVGASAVSTALLTDGVQGRSADRREELCRRLLTFNVDAESAVLKSAARPVVDSASRAAKLPRSSRSTGARVARAFASDRFEADFTCRRPRRYEDVASLLSLPPASPTRCCVGRGPASRTGPPR